jgi:alkylation response protein AidB-like acyl-CoA dehydrogenase
MVVGGRGNGWAVAMGSLGIERFTTALPYQSRFPHQVQAVVNQLRSRSRTTDPMVRQQLAQACSGLSIVEWTNARLLSKIVAGDDLGVRSSLAKLQWATWHRDTSARFVDLLGASETILSASGDLDGSQAAFLNSRAETIYGGANEIQKTILAERHLGLPREPT